MFATISEDSRAGHYLRGRTISVQRHPHLSHLHIDVGVTGQMGER